jgi:TRAP-type C4-dicarboxylate transport system substrate-binding protein
MYVEWIKLLGGSPTPMPWSELYSGLSQGVVDGAEAPPRSLIDQRHYEVIKYVSLTEHIYNSTPIVVSAKWLNKQSPEHKEIIVQECQKAGEFMTKENIRERQDSIKFIKDKGVTVIENPDRQAFRKATGDLHTKFPKWTPGLYQQVLKAMGG